VDGHLLDGSMESFQRAYNSSKRPHIMVEVLRSGTLLTIQVPVKNQQVKTEVFESYVAFSGLVVRDLNSFEKEILGLEEGVIVGSTYNDPISPVSSMIEGSVITQAQGPNGPIKIKNISRLRNYLQNTPPGSFLQLRTFVSNPSMVGGDYFPKPVQGITRPSKIVTLPFTGVVTSNEIPLEEFRKNYDFTGLDSSRSHLGAVIQSLCEMALNGEQVSN
jgi:hypothetical protein